jgi:hypothetical protein
MAKTLTVVLDGLCGFAKRANGIEVYLFSGGHHAQHGQHLLLRTDLVDVPATSWMPTTVGMIRDIDEQTHKPVLRQIAIWSLTKLEATFASGTGVPSWSNNVELIDFKTEHGGSSTLAKNDIKNNDAKLGVVTLVGDQTVLTVPRPGANDNFVLKKNGATHKQGAFSRIVEWIAKSNSVPSLTNAAGEKITLRGDLDAWWGSVSNVAPVKATAGLTHFEHYYHGVKIKNDDFKMTIEQAFADVYDCVPPVAYP